jgi:hypothetical protein
MALALFRRTEPLSPARAALAEHLREVQALQLKRQQLSERDARARVDREQGEVSAAKVAALSQACDQARADQRYGAGGADLPALEAQLREAEVAHGKVAGIARSAQIASAKYSADAAALTAQSQELSKLTARLLHSALLEIREARKARYEAARVEMVNALRHALEPTFACDAIALQNGWPVLGSDAAFSALEIPALFPQAYDDNDTAAKIEHGKALEAAVRQHQDDYRLTQQRGAELAQRLLDGKAID